MKKIISILLVCFLCLSMATIVGAAETYGDLTIEYTKYDADSFNPNGYIKVDVYVDNLKGLELTNLPAAGGFGGYDAVGMELHYDASVFTPGYTSEIVPGTGVTQVTVGVNKSDWPLLTDSSPFNSAGSFVTANPSPFAEEGYIKYGTGHAGYVCAGTTGFDAASAPSYYPALGKVRFATFYLTINDNAPATTNLWLENVEFAHATYGYKHNSFNLGTAEVVISEEEGGDDVVVPEETDVKTFPKRFYEADANKGTLTTIGLIIEGKDYDADKVVAGIYADGKAFNMENGPIATAGKKYIVVGLTGVNAKSAITVDTPTKAYVNFGGADICGAEVTDYTDNKAYVVPETDGDIAGFAEAK